MKVLQVVNEAMSVVGYLAIMVIAWLAISGRLHAFGEGPLGVGRLICVW